MVYIIKIDTKENLKTFLDVINAQNTLELSREDLQIKLEETFDLKIKEFNEHKVPENLRDYSIFVRLDNYHVSAWSFFVDKINFYLIKEIYTVDSFIEAQYKIAMPKFSKLFKIPVPSCYKNISYDDNYVELYREEIEKFRNELPDFSLWSDSQIVAFGEDYSTYIDLVSSFQGANPETTRDIVLAMLLYDVEMDKIYYNKPYFNHSGLDEKGAYGLYKLLTENNAS